MASLKAISLFALTALASVASAGPSTGKSYTVSPASFSNLCVVPAGDWDGARLTLADCDTSDDIAWTFDGRSLKNSATQRCVDVIDGGHWNGNGLQTWTCFDDNTNQRFSPSDGAIQWTGQNMCIDLTDGNGYAGNNLQLWQCYSWNTNQQWTFTEVEEVDDCGDGSCGNDSEDCETSAYPSASASASPTIPASASDYVSASATISGSASVSAPTESASASASSLGGELSANSSSSAWYSASASANWSESSSAAWSASSSAAWSASSSAAWSASSSADWNASSSAPAWASASASASESASATASSSAPSASASVGSGGSGNADMSGYLQVSGTKVVDANGNTVQSKGTNLGGWLVWEDWMCGITDNSGSADRFPQTTLENRFGEEQTRESMKVWQDNWLVSSDFDNLAAMGFNVLRLPFSYRNFIRSDGTYITDSSGNLDLSRLDWAVAQAKARGMYVIPTYHIWDGQEQRYSTISEDSAEGKAQRDKAGELWTKIAAHFAGETAIAAFDAINEPTGSANNNLQRDSYHAIRAGDSKRIIIMESIANSPDSDWTNVMYSMHEYLMMGESDDGYNQYMFEQGVRADTNQYTSVGVPTYIGEFMASGNTLTWMLEQMNDMGVWWSGWTYKTVNMDRWGSYNFGSNMYVDVSSDSFDSLKSAWSNMGGIWKSRVADQYASAAGGSAKSKRDEIAERAPIVSTGEKKRAVFSPRVGGARSAMKRSTPHAGRSRRQVHGAKS